jgi:uncharacterized paraquat-inducible protein A
MVDQERFFEHPELCETCGTILSWKEESECVVCRHKRLYEHETDELYGESKIE